MVVISLIIGYWIGYLVMYKQHEKFLIKEGYLRTHAPFKYLK